MPKIKIVDFTSVQSWAILPSKMVRGQTKFIVLWHQFVCSRLFTPCYWGVIQRLRKCQLILNQTVLPIYWVVLTKILWRKMRTMLKNSQTHKVMSLVDVTWHFGDSNVIFEDEIAHVCVLLKQQFYCRHLKFWNCVFQILYFHFMWKNVSLHKHLNNLFVYCGLKKRHYQVSMNQNEVLICILDKQYLTFWHGHNLATYYKSKSA